GSCRSFHSHENVLKTHPSPPRSSFEEFKVGVAASRAATRTSMSSLSIPCPTAVRLLLFFYAPSTLCRCLLGMQGNSGLVIRFVPGEFTFFKEISKANRRFGQALVSSVFKCALRPMVLSVALVYLVAEVNEWREKGYSVTEQRG